MSYYPASIQNLIKHIARFPGIGEKTAERLALHILRAPRQEAQDLAQSILDIKDKVKFCSKCFALSDSELMFCSQRQRTM
jgi:recombination protein RecR